jgi:4-amino-4-deoxy-L-arabinose transferase-like glycosyltransferase
LLLPDLSRVSQVVGLIEAGLLAFVLYRWLARVFPTSDAFLASATGIIICMANRTEELHALHMSAIFHTTLAGAVATLAVDARRVRTSYAFWGGLLAGLALLIKQTSGVAAVVSLPLMLALAARQFYGWKEARRAFSLSPRVVRYHCIDWNDARPFGLRNYPKVAQVVARESGSMADGSSPSLG